MGEKIVRRGSSSQISGMNFSWVWYHLRRLLHLLLALFCLAGPRLPRGGLRSVWRVIADHFIWPLFSGWPVSGLVKDAGNFCAHSLSCGGIQLLWCCILAAGYTYLADRVFTVVGYVYNDGADHYYGDGLFAGMAIGMGAYRIDYSADFDTCSD